MGNRKVIKVQPSDAIRCRHLDPVILDRVFLKPIQRLQDIVIDLINFPVKRLPPGSGNRCRIATEIVQPIARRQAVIPEFDGLCEEVGIRFPFPKRPVNKDLHNTSWLPAD